MREEEARIRHRLGMALWQAKDPERARSQLDQASSILESVRRETPKGAAEKRLSLFDLQTECYQALQRVLVRLGREDEALVVAEKARNRAMADLMRDQGGKKAGSRLSDRTPSSVSEIVTLVNRQKASVLYYSLAAGYLYAWLIVPTKGVVKFHQVRVSGEDDDENEDECSFGFSLLTERVRAVRESLGVINSGDGKAAGDNADNNGEEEGMWSSHLDALGDKLNQEGDRSGFLRMVNRGSRLNASTYSLSSLFSVGSVGCGSTVSGVTAVSSKHHGSTRSRRRNAWQGPQALRKLYELLLEPLEDDLPEGYPCELTLVLEGDLYLVPWAMLKSPHCPETLSEKYNLLVAPSITAIKLAKGKSKTSSTVEEQREKTLVVGNPKIPSSVSDQWGWSDIPHASQEASLISEVLQSNEPLTGDNATKEAVMARLAQAECVHLACHVSWKLSAIVFSPGEFVDSNKTGNTNKRYSINSDTIHEEEDLKSEVASSGTDLDDAPSLSEFLLTAGDILNLKLSAKLVVISSCHTRDETHGAITSDGLIALTRALLAAGAQCVLVSLWPVPIAAVKVVMKAFYSSLLQGSKTSKALAEATATVQSTKQLQHPANWAGFVLIGADIKLNNKEALLGQALKDMLMSPETCRDALRVTLHLVSKNKYLN